MLDKLFNDVSKEEPPEEQKEEFIPLKLEDGSTIYVNKRLFESPKWGP